MKSLSNIIKYYKSFVRDANKFIYNIENTIEIEKIGLFNAPIFVAYYDEQGNFDREKSNRRHERAQRKYHDKVNKFHNKVIEEEDEEIILLNRPLVKPYTPIIKTENEQIIKIENEPIIKTENDTVIESNNSFSYTSKIYIAKPKVQKVKENKKELTINDLPLEIQNKVMYFCLEHPCATMISNEMRKFKENENHIFNVFDKIAKNKFSQRNRNEMYWNNFISKIREHKNWLEFIEQNNLRMRFNGDEIMQLATIGLHS